MGYRLRAGDLVIVTTGADKGSVGTILDRVGDRVRVTNAVNSAGVATRVATATKHLKRKEQTGEGVRETMERYIDVSNVAPYSKTESKKVKLKLIADTDGKRFVYMNKAGESITYFPSKK